MLTEVVSLGRTYAVGHVGHVAWVTEGGLGVTVDFSGFSVAGDRGSGSWAPRAPNEGGAAGTALLRRSVHQHEGSVENEIHGYV